MQRYRAKKKGEANTQLVMWQDQTAKNAPVHWWLLATKGSGLVHERVYLHKGTKSPTGFSPFQVSAECSFLSSLIRSVGK